MNPGDRIRVPFGDRRHDAIVSYVSGEHIGVLIDIDDSEPLPGLYRLEELTEMTQCD